jgi:antagonist of KipI
VTIRIIGAGLQTTIQDLGRPTHQHEGIPGCGAMDRVAHRMANILIGNDEGLATLEGALMGPALAFDEDSLIAVTGGDLGATVDGSAIGLWQPLWVPKGATLRFEKMGAAMPTKAGRGCRTYVSAAGGIDVPVVFGSRSTYLRASFGGLQGRALRVGDELTTGKRSTLNNQIADSIRGDGSKPRAARWIAGATIRPRYGEDVIVRLVEGAHTSELSNDSQTVLTSSLFRISSSSDRMGYRLEGATLSLATPREMMSEAVAFGTVQLPPGGSPIILMADRQTTGGYPRIGEVASVDLPLIAQLKPGDRLRFRFISLDEAHRLYLELERDIVQAKLAIALRFPHVRH